MLSDGDGNTSITRPLTIGSGCILMSYGQSILNELQLGVKVWTWISIDLFRNIQCWSSTNTYNFLDRKTVQSVHCRHDVKHAYLSWIHEPLFPQLKQITYLAVILESFRNTLQSWVGWQLSHHLCQNMQLGPHYSNSCSYRHAFLIQQGSVAHRACNRTRIVCWREKPAVYAF